MKKEIYVFGIDPQKDFCDLPDEWCPEVIDPENPANGLVKVKPALPVPGAHADMLRFGELIRKGYKGITDITVTLDSHHHVGIERPTLWRDASGNSVSPFTEITASAVRAGQYLPRDMRILPKVLAYLDTLEANSLYKLMIWTIHCEIGTWGHSVHDAVRSAYNVWEEKELGIVQKVTKGSNPWTEHYSALMAEVPDPDDHTTQLNTELIKYLDKGDLILVGGEAGSHCVKATMEHLVSNFGQDSVKKIVLLRDCISAVAGFEAQYQAFLTDMQNKGVQIATSVDILPELIANSRR